MACVPAGVLLIEADFILDSCRAQNGSGVNHIMSSRKSICRTRLCLVLRELDVKRSQAREDGIGAELIKPR